MKKTLSKAHSGKLHTGRHSHNLRQTRTSFTQAQKFNQFEFQLVRFHAPFVSISVV